MRLDKKTINTVLAAVLAVVLIFVAYDFFDVGTRWDLGNAIDDILDSRQVAQARKALRRIEDRGRVVAALKAAVEEDTPLVQGKIALLDTLAEWQEPRAMRRALDSGSKSSRRAAAWKFHGDSTVRGKVEKITLDWIEDEGADARSFAALIVTRLELKQAVPVLEKAIMAVPEDPEDVHFAAQALDALYQFRPKGFSERVMQIAVETRQHQNLRSKAFGILGRLEDSDTAKVQALMVKVLKDKGESKLLRGKAASVLHNKRFANKEVQAVIEEVLLRAGDDGVIQRSCLFALFAWAPLDKVRQLLLRREIYQHPFFGIRIDVCTGLAAMNIRNQLALEIFCQLMEDRDEKDLGLMVPQEAWLSFWAMTGQAHGIDARSLFSGAQPKPLRDEADIRAYISKPAQLRLGVSFPMVQAVQRLVCKNITEVLAANRQRKPLARIRDTEAIRKVAEISRSNIGQAKKRWAEQAEAEKKKQAEKKKAGKKVEDQGPKAPDGDTDDPKKDGSKKG